MTGTGPPSNPPSINGSTTPIYTDISFTDKGSSLHRIAIVLAVLFFLTTVIFLVLFAVYYTKYDDEVSASSAAVVSVDKVCNKPDCVLAAAMMAKKMNFSANPCTDFSEYACGRFIKEAVLPEGRTRVGTFSVLGDENKLIMKDIIAQDIKQTDRQYLKDMKRLYMSCFNESRIEDVGLAPYLNESAFIDDWPTLNPDWKGDNFTLNEVIARYERVYIEPIFSYYASTDMMNSSRKVLYLSEGNLGLSMEYFGKPRNDSFIMAYETYLIETAVALNATRATAERDAKEVVDLEIALSKIMVPREDRRDSSKQYNPVLLSDLSNLYPQLDIPGAIRAAFDTANLTLEDDERVINRFPTYIGNISLVVQNFTSRTLQNLFGFKYALSRVGSLTRRMREIRLKFDTVYTGNKAESPRWEVCLDSSSAVFWKGMAKEYVNRTFPETAKRYMEGMIGNLKAEFKKMVEENTWMSDKTKTEAYKKLEAIKQKIGYPDFNFTETDIEQFYENYTMTEDNYYTNRVRTNILSNLEGIVTLRKPVDRNEWSMAPYEVNAYYSRSVNEIAFPAGILQSPFFSQTFQDSMNYGAIGVVIGHEITHGFDDQGSQYDAAGNLRNWWQPTDRENFVKNTKCIVDQNSGFRVDEINMTLNGINTQGESVADNGGVKESFRAYKELVRKNGENPTLPGLELTQDQIFFLAYGQLWCDKMTPQRYISQVTTGVHPPGKFRIIGPLQNSPEFAKAYNCPQGSYMNPAKKCSVW
ncbi:hypothetical protein BsWGS_26869 [Bradybaena similaris]